MFDVLIESSPNIRIQNKIFPIIVSTILHSLVLIVAIMLPLYFTETLNPEKFVTYLVAPPPPPRPLLPLRRQLLPGPLRWPNRFPN